MSIIGANDSNVYMILQKGLLRSGCNSVVTYIMYESEDSLA